MPQLYKLPRTPCHCFHRAFFHRKHGNISDERWMFLASAVHFLLISQTIMNGNFTVQIFFIHFSNNYGNAGFTFWIQLVNPHETTRERSEKLHFSRRWGCVEVVSPPRHPHSTNTQCKDKKTCMSNQKLKQASVWPSTWPSRRSRHSKS